MTLDDRDFEITSGCAAVHPDRMGGQHVAKHCTGVRITHRPTGITMLSTDERSQHANREVAMRCLRIRLDAMAAEDNAARDAPAAFTGSVDELERHLESPDPRDARIADLRSGHCLSVIPETFITCGEGGNYCSEACRLRAALVEACDIADRTRLMLDQSEIEQNLSRIAALREMASRNINRG